LSLRDTIDKDGFASIPNFFSQADIARLLGGISASSAHRSRAGLRHALSLAPVSDIARQASVMELARSVLGTEAFPFRATLFDKSPKSNWLVVWHQDTALPLRQRHEVQGWGPWSVKEDSPTLMRQHRLSLKFWRCESISTTQPR
jgi:hypothetical protein